jgi:iron complex transport system ATP-binding protein
LYGAYADRLGLLHNGRVVATGPPTELLIAAPLDRVFEHPLSITVDPETGIPAVIPRRVRR